MRIIARIGTSSIVNYIGDIDNFTSESYKQLDGICIKVLNFISENLPAKSIELNFDETNDKVTKYIEKSINKKFPNLIVNA